jgi:hypothetical protein
MPTLRNGLPIGERCALRSITQRFWRPPSRWKKATWSSISRENKLARMSCSGVGWNRNFVGPESNTFIARYRAKRAAIRLIRLRLEKPGLNFLSGF